MGQSAIWTNGVLKNSVARYAFQPGPFFDTPKAYLVPRFVVETGSLWLPRLDSGLSLETVPSKNHVFKPLWILTCYFHLFSKCWHLDAFSKVFTDANMSCSMKQRMKSEWSTWRNLATRILRIGWLELLGCFCFGMFNRKQWCYRWPTTWERSHFAKPSGLVSELQASSTLTFWVGRFKLVLFCFELLSILYIDILPQLVCNSILTPCGFSSASFTFGLSWGLRRGLAGCCGASLPKTCGVSRRCVGCPMLSGCLISGWKHLTQWQVNNATQSKLRSELSYIFQLVNYLEDLRWLGRMFIHCSNVRIRLQVESSENIQNVGIAWYSHVEWLC